jgi:6-phosphogluconolactonase
MVNSNVVRGAGKPALSVRRFADRAELTEALADRLQRALAGGDAAAPAANVAARPAAQSSGASATHRSGAPAVMLSGGETPMPAYRLLAQRGLEPEPGLSIFFSDDRYVPSDSDASNFHQSRPLLDALALGPERVLRVKTELPLADAAADYDRALASLVAGGARFGLGLLGLGADGHTASLFGRPDIERARGHRAIAVHRPDGRDAVSVTPAVLALLAEIVFVVAGAQKRAALAALLDRNPELTAWQAVSGCEAVEVWADGEALPAR